MSFQKKNNIFVRVGVDTMHVSCEKTNIGYTHVVVNYGGLYRTDDCKNL